MDDSQHIESIHVVVRFRPESERELRLSAREEEKGESTVKVGKGPRISSAVANSLVEFPSKTQVQLHPSPTHSGISHPIAFAFDHCFDRNATQSAVYHFSAERIVQNVLCGFNGTIFAYGQTGSGKTHSMLGPTSDPGVIPRAVDHLFTVMECVGAPEDVPPAELKVSKERFDSLRKQFADVTEVLISCSMLEIYKEKLRDLLTNERRRLQVRESHSEGVYVEGLTRQYVSSRSEVFDLLDFGQGMRSVAATKMNALSSRSHTLFLITIEQHLKSGSRKTAKLNLVDLAGSEKVNKTGAEGNVLEEAKMINKSLFALGHCLKALGKRQSAAGNSAADATHIPYRDSKLTFLLRESLGGNAKTAVILACSPHADNQMETLSTLRMGQLMKCIRNKVQVNEQKSVSELEAEIRKLKSLLAKYKEALQSGGMIVEGGIPSSETREETVEVDIGEREREREIPLPEEKEEEEEDEEDDEEEEEERREREKEREREIEELQKRCETLEGEKTLAEERQREMEKEIAHLKNVFLRGKMETVESCEGFSPTTTIATADIDDCTSDDENEDEERERDTSGEREREESAHGEREGEGEKERERENEEEAERENEDEEEKQGEGSPGHKKGEIVDQSHFELVVQYYEEELSDLRSLQTESGELRVKMQQMERLYAQMRERNEVLERDNRVLYSLVNSKPSNTTTSSSGSAFRIVKPLSLSLSQSLSLSPPNRHSSVGEMMQRNMSGGGLSERIGGFFSSTPGERERDKERERDTNGERERERERERDFGDAEERAFLEANPVIPGTKLKKWLGNIFSWREDDEDDSVDTSNTLSAAVSGEISASPGERERERERERDSLGRGERERDGEREREREDEDEDWNAQWGNSDGDSDWEEVE